ncbi:MAG: proline--tRNA ligase [Deltaproteobacteria bacterium]|nr:proline--tRNA ligase [Deltaproteobacteria bacterium]
MKFSKSLIHTYREAPADAEVISHNLLVRAGMIRKVTAGIYEYLPLGLKSLKKVENIIRNELNRAGCQEVLLPHLVPGELWKESDRWAKYGKELLRLSDRHGREYCFGPTHEETICDLVRHVVSSYKALPQNLYQIQTKFRDEIRPRFGLMRGREFLMKDGYSFHVDHEDLDREYKNMFATYKRIFERCGLTARAVDADTGAIGGKSSHEFMVIAQTGEDVVVYCSACDYAANLEKASCRTANVGAAQEISAVQEVHTPGLKTVDEVAAFLKIKPQQMIKTLVYKADQGFIVVCTAGDREVSEIKLQNIAKAEALRLATDEEVVSFTGVPVGFLGPVGLDACIRKTALGAQWWLVYDHSVKGIVEAATGANRADYHVVHVAVTRDLKLSEDNLVDVCNVIEGDPCPHCSSGQLKLTRGIEVGHIFKLGFRYSKPMKVTYLDNEGKEQPVVMGTYGIGVGRTMAASVEQNHDDKGIIWPRALAPFDVHLIQLDHTDAITQEAQKIYDALWGAGIEALWDDRDERAGVKFNDADLIGIPVQVIIGKRGLQKGTLEYKIRRTSQKGEAPLLGAVDIIAGLLNAAA